VAERGRRDGLLVVFAQEARQGIRQSNLVRPSPTPTTAFEQLRTGETRDRATTLGGWTALPHG
jgi:hypothetical protein